MSNFIPTNLNQSLFFDLNYLEVLGDDTFEYFLYQLLETEIDLSAFYDIYKNNKVGRKAYHPALLLRVIFYAYYRGMISSREIERACKTDLKFIALAAGTQPHFTTLANFVSTHSETMKDLFHRILLICDQSNLIGKEHFAIDGCKIACDASRQWSGTHKELAKKSDKLKKTANRIIERHKDNDSDKSDGNGQHKEEKQKIETLLMNAKKIDDFLNTNEKRIGVGKQKNEVQSNITDNESAKMKTNKGMTQGYVCVTVADDKRQIIVNADSYGMGTEHTTLIPSIEGIKKYLGNDVLDSAVITADTGFSSESNMKYIFENKIDAVIPDNQYRKRDEKFIKSETYNEKQAERNNERIDTKSKNKYKASVFKFDSELNTCVCPNNKSMRYMGDHYETTAGLNKRFVGELKDCRNCPLQQKCMHNPVKEKGRQVSFLRDDKRTVKFMDIMKEKIDSAAGRRIYSKRMWTIEPVFGNICSNKKLSKSNLRGKTKVNGQWLMYCMIHNLEKLWKYGERELMA
ncbi:MAG: IS1182 family transposase [Pseudomonadales bacterium]|nr:IS1182 family transposase [Pseudomonadales bacterium]